MSSFTQLIQYIRPDGTIINLNSPPRRLARNMSGWGYPPLNIHQIAGPYQHGTSVLGYRFQPRTITLDLMFTGVSRHEWWGERTKLISRMGLQTTNPNYTELGTLRWEYVENSVIKQRDVDCYLNRGLLYSPNPQWREWGLVESLEFVAADPIIYDPTQVTVTVGPYVEQLVLPMEFPFILGVIGATESITYTGSWATFPIIEVDGPTNGVYIENSTLEYNIRMDYFIDTGVTVTFDLSLGAKTVTDNLGNNLINYVSPDSNLAQFVIEQDPFAPGGLNDFIIYLSDTDTPTEVRIKYYTRYIGI